jgi:biopolymer transport protein TolR
MRSDVLKAWALAAVIRVAERPVLPARTVTKGTGCMNNLLKACRVALTIIAAVNAPVAAQSPVLRAGVSVELADASNAVAMPDADEQDSLILAVTAQGRVYFGITPTSPADLAEKVKGGLSGRTGKKIYIKGDARTSYAGMAKVLDAVRMAGVEAPNLLTAQRDSPEPGKLLSPKGLEVLVGPSLPSAAESIVVQVLNAGQRPTLSIKDERISLDALQATLRQLFQNRSQKTVVLRADERLPFGDVVRVIDTCRSAGATVFLATAGM